MKRYFIIALLILGLFAAVSLTAAQTVFDGVERTGLSCSNGETVRSFVKITKPDGTVMTATDVDAYEIQSMKDIKDRYRKISRPGWVSYPADCVEVQP